MEDEAISIRFPKVFGNISGWMKERACWSALSFYFFKNEA
jgi:hypothetical protein